MGMLKIIRSSFFAFCAGLAWPAFSGQQQVSATADAVSKQGDSAGGAPAAVEMPMNRDEPMQGGMKKPGMMKDDVKKSAEKKDKKMKEMLEKEQESMPPMPKHEP
ncbi:MAG: hypothetical protein P8173_18190 [Gammaproteobacteria bacterium]